MKSWTLTFTVKHVLKYVFVEAYIGLINTTKLACLKINYGQGPKAASTQQMPSLSVSMSLFPNNLNSLQAGLADNAALLSKHPSPTSVMSNINPTITSI